MLKSKVHHLSHIDLDGYSCQLIAKNYFKNIDFYNSNYGKEIDERLQEILNNIDKEREKNRDNQFLILITDLNLNQNQAKFLDDEVKKRENITILLLDHHITGKDESERYNWYYLDEKRCATKITYDYLSFKYGKNEKLARFSEIVNAVDIWLNRSPYFELGKVLMKLVSDSKEINRNMFPKEHTNYIFILLESAMRYFENSNAHIKLDDNIHNLKKRFFREKENNTIDNLVANYIVNILNREKERMTIYYKGYKGILTYNIGSVSILGNTFLLKNRDYDFFMDITGRRTVSLRSNNRCDVSKMAKEIGNGGGHINASGAYLKSFKDSFLYEDVKKQVEEILQSIENREEKDGFTGRD